MRYAFISDIHSNLEAFDAVLNRLRDEDIDQYIVLGDIVGYGADPAACIAKVRQIAPAVFVAGNHDWGAAGLLDLDYFNDYARAALVWTKGRLSTSDSAFLRSGALVHRGDDFELAHGSLDQPQLFDYIMDEHDARGAIVYMKTDILFVGHTHIPGTYILDKGEMFYSDGEHAEIAPGKRYVVNTGSVGQPRDGDPRSCAVIYDTGLRTVTFIRTEYNIAAAQGKIIGAGLPAWLAERLSTGR